MHQCINNGKSSLPLHQTTHGLFSARGCFLRVGMELSPLISLSSSVKRKSSQLPCLKKDLSLAVLCGHRVFVICLQYQLESLPWRELYWGKCVFEEILQVGLKAQTALCLLPGSGIPWIKSSPWVFCSSVKDLAAGISRQTNQI